MNTRPIRLICTFEIRAKDDNDAYLQSVDIIAKINAFAHIYKLIVHRNLSGIPVDYSREYDFTVEFTLSSDFGYNNLKELKSAFHLFCSQNSLDEQTRSISEQNHIKT